MPELDDLWSAVDQKKSEEIITLINKYPELIDKPRPNATILLLRGAIAKDCPDTVIETLITLPKFDFNKKESDQHGTQRKVLIRQANIKLITLASNNPKFLFSNEESAYTVALETQNQYKEDIKRPKLVNDPKCRAAVSLNEKIERLNQIIPMLYETSILYAIKHDDVDCLKLMKNKGINLNQPLNLQGKKIEPYKLAGENSNVYKWFIEQRKPNNVANPNTLFSPLDLLKKLESEKIKAREEFLQRQDEILRKSEIKLDDLMDQAHRVTKKL